MRIRIKTIECVNGKLYGLYRDNRQFLTDCDIKMELYENRVAVPVLGSSGKVKKYEMVVIVGSAINKNLATEIIEHIKAYDLQVDVKKSKDINAYERILFHNIMPLTIDTLYEWHFEIVDKDKIKTLLEM